MGGASAARHGASGAQMRGDMGGTRRPGLRMCGALLVLITLVCASSAAPVAAWESNPLAASDIDVSVVNGAQVCGTSVSVIGLTIPGMSTGGKEVTCIEHDDDHTG